MDSVIILCDGQFPTEAYPLYLLENAEGLVCCDGAYRQYRAHFPDGKAPLVVIGDLDSLSPEEQAALDCPLVQVSEQDDNDMTKALRWVLENHPEAGEIVFLGATGLREDHTVGNLGLLMDYPRQFDLGDRRLSLVSDYGTAFPVTDTCELHLGEGRRFSLFSADNSLRISSEGLQWPTDDVVFDAWWKATLNRTTAPIVSLHFSHPSLALVLVD